MNQSQKLFRISQLLSRFREQVKILNSNGEFTINLHAENILIKVLNEVYGWNLENVNYTEGKNYPAIDLRDKAARIAVQVTSTSSIAKQKATVNKFIANGLDKDFALYIFIITDKPAISLTPNCKVLDRTDLYRELNAQNDIEKIDRVIKLLEAQFVDAAAIDKWQLYCKGLGSYDQYMHHRYHFLEIKGFSPKINNTLVKINLENIYVPLTLKMENVNSEETYFIEEALTSFKKMVILGDPGSGKSTLLKHLAYKICSNRQNDPQFTEWVPVLIKGSEYAKFLSTSAKSLAEFIIDQLDKKYDHLFIEKLEAGQLILLIDGIDEINRIKLRHDVVDRINAFVAQYPDIKIVVTSRIVGYKEVRLNGHFHHLEVGTFGHEQIRQFTHNWYASIQHTESDFRVLAGALFNAICKNRSVYNMASSPLLITIIALIHYQGNTLPEKRAALYEVATATFLENWVRQREVDKPSNFDKEMLVEMLSPISFHIHCNYTTGLITESELKTLLLQEYRKINPRLTSKEEKNDVRDIIEFLREDAGFLFEKGRNDQGEALFGFVHQTFQEYFAAIEFVARWKEGAFKDNLDVFVFDASWREVITLAAAIFRLNDNTRIGRLQASGFLKDLLYIKDPFPEISRPLRIVLSILDGDVEVEFGLVEEVMDTAFEMMINDKESFDEAEYYEEGAAKPSHSLLMKDLLCMRKFRDYLNERFVEVIKREKIPHALIGECLYHLVGESGTPVIKKELVNILRGKDNVLKWPIFNHTVVCPVAEILETKAFEEEMVKFVNSTDFAENYKGEFPTLFLRGVYREGTYFGHYSQEEPRRSISEQHLFSLKQLTDQKMRVKLASHFVKHSGIFTSGRLDNYLNWIKKEFPDMDVSSIETQCVSDVELYPKGMNYHTFMQLGSIKVDTICNFKNKFAFLDHTRKVEILEYPFKIEDVRRYFKVNTADIKRLFDLVIPALNSESKEMPVPCTDDLLLFVRYYDNIKPGILRLDLEKVFNAALDFITNEGPPSNSTVLNWLKKTGFYKNSGVEVNKKFTCEKYKRWVYNSNISPEDKLFLLQSVGGKTDDEHLIAAVIDRYRSAECMEERKWLRGLLQKALE